MNIFVAVVIRSGQLQECAGRYSDVKLTLIKLFCFFGVLLYFLTTLSFFSCVLEFAGDILSELL